MKRLPQLRMSQTVSGPMTIGVLRTLVLLPTSALLALNPEQLEAVFAHELAHVRRADYFWNLVQTLAETLFFFHPAVRWLGKRLREQRELCCDDIAVETCDDPLVYATALFRLEDQRATGTNLAMALDGHQSGIPFRARILRILGEATPQSQLAQLRPLSLLAVFGSLFVFLSPAPKALGAAAQKLPVKQMLAVPSEIVRVAHMRYRASVPRELIFRVRTGPRLKRKEMRKPQRLRPTRLPMKSRCEQSVTTSTRAATSFCGTRVSPQPTRRRWRLSVLGNLALGLCCN